jgi:hypothetical protein
MSRFIEILNEGPCEFNSGNFDKIIDKVREKLESDTAHITLEFPFLGDSRLNGNMRTLIVRTIFRNTLGTWAKTGNRHHDLYH